MYVCMYVYPCKEKLYVMLCNEKLKQVPPAWIFMWHLYKQNLFLAGRKSENCISFATADVSNCVAWHYAHRTVLGEANLKYFETQEKTV